jgi:uncharacterized protein DUF4031
MIMCHMMADTLGELHAMADRIGVARKWVQEADRPSDVHYDISLGKRAAAVKAGAVEVTLREMAAYQWHRRTFGFSTPPANALETMLATTRELARRRL